MFSKHIEDYLFEHNSDYQIITDKFLYISEFLLIVSGEWSN